MVRALKRQFLYLNTYTRYALRSAKKGDFSFIGSVYVVFLLTVLTFAKIQKIRKLCERQILWIASRVGRKEFLIEGLVDLQTSSDAQWDYVNHPIDFVYTWVDGSDPEWISEKETWRSRFFGDATQELDNPAGDQRFRQNNELYFSVLSVVKHAPWIRTIYIVTNGQRPSWLPLDIEGIKVVTHDQLLSKEFLPTFNSHVIESSLHKISGLAEHYVYFNDDILLNQDVSPLTFFESPGVSYAFLGVTRPPASFEISGDNNTWTNVNLASMNLLIESLGIGLSGKTLDNAAKTQLVKTCLPAFPGHNPHPQLKSRLIRLEQDHEQLINNSRENKFRTYKDISLASSLQVFTGLLDGTARRGSWQGTYLRTGSAQRLIWLLNLGWSSRKTSICLNDAVEQSHAELPTDVVSAVLTCYFHLRETST